MVLKRRGQTLEFLAYHQAEIGRWAGAGRGAGVVAEVVAGAVAEVVACRVPGAIIDR